MSDSAPLLLPPAEEPSRDPSSELSAPESSGEDGPQCEVGTEARATEAEVALATAHTPGPCDRECASASEVSDCVGSWTEVSSVCSEDLAAFEVAIAAADQGQRIDEGDRAMVDDCRVGGAPELEQTSRDGAADTGMAEKSHEPGSAETEGRGEGQVEGADAVPASETPTDIALNAATKQISGVQAASAAPSSIQSPAAGQTVLTCKACTKAPTSPIVTMCGHVFCHRCILNALTSTLSCPTCDRPIFVKLDL
ncbi:Ring finger domain-containing protein [Phanerochaete sordida]|uniref:Ring finger domain-containing protein n=1 Tax=Phanerochaete sordida TaxID=48140 RepID=A0A9P3L9Y8_9APHY|nr:Ring finger domain-containing protein [Phanerochaete sordida]